MEIGDRIRARQFEAADDLAGALLRRVVDRPDVNEPVQIEFTPVAIHGLNCGWAMLCGARDAGRVDPDCAELIDEMLSGVQELMAGSRSASRFTLAYFLANLALLLPSLDEAEMDEDEEEEEAPDDLPEMSLAFAALADVIEAALAQPRESDSDGQDDRPAGMLGAEYAIPWPTPLPPGCTALSFRGAGNQISQDFVLAGDGALRIAAEKGPFILRVRRPDGTTLSDVADMADGGLGLMAIPEGGTYRLEIETPARWGVTVVFESEP